MGEQLSCVAWTGLIAGQAGSHRDCARLEADAVNGGELSCIAWTGLIAGKPQVLRKA